MSAVRCTALVGPCVCVCGTAVKGWVDGEAPRGASSCVVHLKPHSSMSAPHSAHNIYVCAPIMRCRTKFSHYRPYRVCVCVCGDVAAAVVVAIQRTHTHTHTNYPNATGVTRHVSDLVETQYAAMNYAAHIGQLLHI